MANITELQLQGDSTVHKLNDARITTTAVDTATHILTMATNSGETSIAPITAANLASVLGADVGSVLGIKVIDVDASQDWIDTGISGGICLYLMNSYDSYTGIFTFNFWSGTIKDLEWNIAFDHDLYVQKSAWNTLKLKGGYKALVIGLK